MRIKFERIKPIPSRSVPVILLCLLMLPTAALADEPEDMPVSTYAEPDDAIVDAVPTDWQRLEIDDDGRSLRVYFSTGAEACYGLARVEVDRSGDTPTVTVWTGLRADAAQRICDAMNYDYHTDLVLEEPLVADGSVPEESAG